MNQCLRKFWFIELGAFGSFKLIFSPEWFNYLEKSFYEMKRRHIHPHADLIEQKLKLK